MMMITTLTKDQQEFYRLCNPITRDQWIASAINCLVKQVETTVQFWNYPNFHEVVAERAIERNRYWNAGNIMQKYPNRNNRPIAYELMLRNEMNNHKKYLFEILGDTSRFVEWITNNKANKALEAILFDEYIPHLDPEDILTTTHDDETLISVVLLCSSIELRTIEMINELRAAKI